MAAYLEIEKVIGREILDSRGNPTVEAEVYQKTNLKLTLYNNLVYVKVL